MTEQIVLEDKRYLTLGRWRIWRPEHRRSSKGYVLESIIVYEEYHKCCMLDWGNVHHINEIPTDNRIENLQGMTRSQHTVLHNKNRIFSEETREKMSRAYCKDMSGRKCSRCGSDKTYMQKRKIGLRPNWLIDKQTVLFICKACWQREYRKQRRSNDKEW